MSFRRRDEGAILRAREDTPIDQIAEQRFAPNPVELPQACPLRSGQPKSRHLPVLGEYAVRYGIGGHVLSQHRITVPCGRTHRY